jgi:two-component system C4-dicarboxylate transport sensor histidine kinase DctB
MKKLLGTSSTESASELELGAFVRGLAHDIANPLNALAMNAELAKVLLDRGDAAAAREVIGRLLADCARCGNLVQSFQQFGAALETSARGIVDARALVNDAIGLVRNEPTAASIEFAVESAAAVLVLADGPAVARALAGLLQNAAEAGAHTVKVRITHAQDHARLEIIDDGEGIQEQWRDRMTEPFFTTRRAQGASGLGLTLAREVMRRHGGTLTIHPNTGAGTVVRVELLAAQGR